MTITPLRELITSRPLSSILVGSLLVGSLALAACGRELTAPQGPVTAHDVTITVAMPGHCIVGGCDPPSSIANNLGLVTVRNAGTATAYVQACGTYSALREEQLLSGQWVMVGPAVMCPMTPGPIVLAAGDSILTNWFFAAGRRRIVVGVAGRLDMSDEALAASSAFDVP